MHILLTRPLEDSYELILKFKKLGHKISHLPLIKIEKKGTEHIGIRLLEETGEPFEINISPEIISVGKEKTNLDKALDEKINLVHLFFDNTIIEIFVNEGLVCATKVIYPNKKNLNFEIFSISEKTVVESIDIWDLNN